MVRHFGIFKFKEGVKEQQVQECFTALKGMVGKIEGLEDIEYGPYNSSEGMNQGFSHGFIMTFRDTASRDAYLPHPIHEEAKQVVLPKLEDVIVFDFIA